MLRKYIYMFDTNMLSKIMIMIYLLATQRSVHVLAYTNQLFNLIEHTFNASSGCGGFTDNPKPVIEIREKLAFTSAQPTVLDEFTFSTVAKPREREPDPYVHFQSVLNKVLFGENSETEEKEIKDTDVDMDVLGLYPSGHIMRAELFQNKTMVHLPRNEWMHPGHSYLNSSSPDFMQIAVNAFAIFLDGSLSDIHNLPPLYVLRSSRSIAMMKIAREKLVATWKVIKGSHKPHEISYRTLEYYRPLFKYINGREMARLDLNNDRILSFIGTHADLDRHQVGVVASEYIKKNKYWGTAKYLNLMNNLLCGVPMKFMRKVPESVYLQLSHQIFYHIRACDPLQRRFFLAMMTRTQVLGKSNSWGARDVARLGLLLTEVEGPDLSAINPEAVAGITPQVMMDMPTRNLKFLTETQVRYLAQKPLNIMTKKLQAYDDYWTMLNSVDNLIYSSNLLFHVFIAIKLVL